MEGAKNIERCFDLLTEEGFGTERQLFANFLDTVYVYWGNLTFEPYEKEKHFGNCGSDAQVSIT